MIAEAIVAGVTSIVLGSLWLADRVHKRETVEDAGTDPMAERRRVLERQRAVWLEAAGKLSTYDNAVRTSYLNAAAKIDGELIALTERKS
jgi:hypothetical protein